MREEEKKTSRYEFKGRVRYSESDHRGTMTLPALINYFQDCSIFHSEEVGMGTGWLEERKKAWVLCYWQICVDRYPDLCEQITIGTFATKFSGLFGHRNFYMLDSFGKRIACANSIWAFVDLETGRPCRPYAELTEAYGTMEPLDMPYEDRKIILPEKFSTLETFPVRKYHIDTNEHVNNAQYVQMAMEMLPGDLHISQVRVEYKKSAVYGDIILPKIAAKGERTVIELCALDERPYAVIEIK